MNHGDMDPWTLAFNEYVNTVSNIEIKHLFFAENPLSPDTYFYSYEQDSIRSAYFNAVYEGLGLDCGKNKADQLRAMQESGVLIWDIFHQGNNAHNGCGLCSGITCGVPIDSEKRTKMIKEGCTLAAFCESLNTLDAKGFKFPVNERDLKIYFMMPQLTSLPIFNHYNSNPKERLMIGGKDLSDRLRKQNELFIPGNDATIFPRHMINVIGGSNTPRPELVKHACKYQFNNLRCTILPRSWTRIGD